jgi:hypothetical protein
MASTVYIDAPGKTQDLFTVKWALRAAGYSIKSTWHDEPNAPSNNPRSHWSPERIEQIISSDVLVVVCGKHDAIQRELAICAGIAIGRALKIIWIGSQIDILNHFRTVTYFSTVDEFRKELLELREPWTPLARESVAA